MTIGPRRVLLYGLLAAAVIEAITCLMRFGLDLQSTRDSAFVARFTFGLRIHHGYFGVVALAVSAFLKQSRFRDALLVVGLALLVSDLAHHFLVLWPVTGNPQFDLLYKK